MIRRALPPLRKSSHRDRESIEHDPGKLSNQLRELALRAHRLVRALDGSALEIRSGDADSEQTLAEVYAQIILLQRNLRVQHLDDLAAYVSALRARVEECMS